MRWNRFGLNLLQVGRAIPKGRKNKKAPGQYPGTLIICGAGGSRTRVQTHPPKAFYMFISALICRNSAGAEQTNLVRIRLDFHYTLTETMCTYPAMV